MLWEWLARRPEISTQSIQVNQNDRISQCYIPLQSSSIILENGFEVDDVEVVDYGEDAGVVAPTVVEKVNEVGCEGEDAYDGQTHQVEDGRR